MIGYYLILIALIIVGVINKDELWGFLLAFVGTMLLIILGCLHFDYNLKEELLEYQSQIIYEDYGLDYTPLELYLMDNEIQNLMSLEGAKIKLVD